jgi:hypothetical protein
LHNGERAKRDLLKDIAKEAVAKFEYPFAFEIILGNLVFFFRKIEFVKFK